MPQAKPAEDKEFVNHDPAAVPAVGGRYDGSCEAPTELRHDHHIFGEDMRWYCSKQKGHLGRHAATHGGGLVASWAQKV